MNELMFIRLTFQTAKDDKPQLNYLPEETKGLKHGPFFVSVPLQYKDKRGRAKTAPLNIRCGILTSGRYFCEAQPLDKSGMCIGYIQQTLFNSRPSIWHFIQARLKPTSKTALT